MRDMEMPAGLGVAFEFLYQPAEGLEAFADFGVQAQRGPFSPTLNPL
jgi:hypothetical protein